MLLRALALAVALPLAQVAQAADAPPLCSSAAGKDQVTGGTNYCTVFQSLPGVNFCGGVGSYDPLESCATTCNLCVKDGETAQDKKTRTDAWKVLCESEWSSKSKYPATCAEATGKPMSPPSPPPTAKQSDDYADDYATTSPPSAVPNQAQGDKDDYEDASDYKTDYDYKDDGFDYSDSGNEQNQLPLHQLPRCPLNSDSDIKCRTMECKGNRMIKIACSLESSVYRTLCPAMCNKCRPDKPAHKPMNKSGSLYPVCPSGGNFTKDHKPVCNLNSRCHNDYTEDTEFALALGISFHPETKRIELCRDLYGDDREGYYDVKPSACASPCLCKGSAKSVVHDALCCPATSLEPTASPTSTPCGDDPNFRTARYADRDGTDSTGTCAWVAEDITRCGYRGANGYKLAKDHCKLTCGQCGDVLLSPAQCADDSTWRSKYGDRGCSWVGENFKRCSLHGTPEFPGPAWTYCKRSCAGCLVALQQQPTVIQKAPAAAKCEDDPAWRHQKVADGDCGWVSEYLPRCNWKGAEGFDRAREHCLKSCSACGNDLLKFSVQTSMVLEKEVARGPCEDDPTFLLVDTKDNVVSGADCDHVRNQPRACNWPGKSSGSPSVVLASTACPKACQLCM